MNWQEYSSYKEFLLSEANNRKTVHLFVLWEQPQKAGNHETLQGCPLPIWPMGTTALGTVPSGHCLWQKEGRWCCGKLHVSSAGELWAFVHTYLMCQLMWHKGNAAALILMLGCWLIFDVYSVGNPLNTSRLLGYSSEPLRTSHVLKVFM